MRLFGCFLGDLDCFSTSNRYHRLNEDNALDTFEQWHSISSDFVNPILTSNTGAITAQIEPDLVLKPDDFLVPEPETENFILDDQTCRVVYEAVLEKWKLISSSLNSNIFKVISAFVLMSDDDPTYA